MKKTETNKKHEIIFRESWRIESSENLITIQEDGSVFVNNELGSLQLPNAYKEFIIKYPGGITPTGEDNFIVAQFEEEAIEVPLEYLLGLESVVSDYSYQYASTFGSGSRLPAKHIIIASGEIDDFVLNIDPKSDNFGKVYNWARAGDPWGTGDNTEGFGLVADNFIELMNNLTKETHLD